MILLIGFLKILISIVIIKNMIYFINGEEKYLIKQKLEEIINQHPNHKLIQFNAETKLNDAIDEISTFSLFEEHKLLVFQDFYLLTKNEEKEIKSLIASLDFMPQDTSVIFIIEKLVDKTNNGLIHYLKIKANSFTFNLMNEKEILVYVKNWIKEQQATISDVNLYYLLSKLPNKLIFIINELEKLIAYDKNISKQNIDDLVAKYETSGAFDFINAFHDQDIERIFKIYYEKINQGESIINLISQIAYALELCSQIYSYQKMNYTNDEIANQLKKHIFVIKKNADLLKMISYGKIQKYLEQLSQLDLQIKENKIDDKIGFEHFLLSIVNDK